MTVFMLILLGLCFGSFVNAFVYRLHEQAKLGTKKVKTTPEQADRLSITKGRSMCSHCKHALSVADLIPVLSWVALRGRCRYCHKKIDDNPIVELAMPVLFVISYLYWPGSFDALGIFNFVLWLVYLTMFMALIVYDLRWMLLPNKIVYPLTVLAVVQVCINAAFNGEPLATLSGALLGALAGGGLFYIIFQVSKGRWIGGGDVKLGVLFGLLVGSPFKSLLVIFVASVIGTLVCLPLLATKRLTAGSRIPFGPLLIAGTIIIYLFGTPLVQWYSGLFVSSGL